MPKAKAVKEPRFHLWAEKKSPGPPPVFREALRGPANRISILDESHSQVRFTSNNHDAGVSDEEADEARGRNASIKKDGRSSTSTARRRRIFILGN